MTRGLSLLVAILLLATAAAPQAYAVEPVAGPKLGLVLMHGKGGLTKLVDSLADSLRAAGVLVDTPLMSWSKHRIYDRDYERLYHQPPRAPLWQPQPGEKHEAQIRPS